MKKLAITLCLGILVVTGCSNQTEGETNLDEIIPTTDQVVVSPQLPEAILVNGEEVIVTEGEFLTVGSTIKSEELMKPTGTFDTMESFLLDELSGWKVVHIVPSLDTPICSLQTRQLNKEAKEMTNVSFLTISADLPFALKRFADFNNIQNMKVYSDYQTHNFLKNNRLYMPEYGLATRAIMILDENNEVQYIEYAKEVTKELDLFNAINFLRQNVNK